MSSIAENINRLMLSEGVTASELSRIVGIDRSVLHKILTGNTKNPSIESIKGILKHYGSEKVLFGSEIENQLGIPIITWTEATSFPTIGLNIDQRQYFKSAKNNSKDLFCLRVEYTLDSRFPKGTLLVIDHKKSPKNLDHVIVKETNSTLALLKRLIMDGSSYFLKSIEPSLPSMQYETSKYKTIGVVIQSIFDFY